MIHRLASRSIIVFENVSISLLHHQKRAIACKQKRYLMIVANDLCIQNRKMQEMQKIANFDFNKSFLLSRLPTEAKCKGRVDKNHQNQFHLQWRETSTPDYIKVV